MKPHPDQQWQRLITAARSAADPRDPSAPFGFATRVAARAFASPAPAGALVERFALRAPISGIVAERKANPGLEVRPDLPDPLYVITDPRHLWAIIDLPEHNLG